jgi:hypothetical protein
MDDLHDIQVVVLAKSSDRGESNRHIEMDSLCCGDAN